MGKDGDPWIWVLGRFSILDCQSSYPTHTPPPTQPHPNSDFIKRKHSSKNFQTQTEVLAYMSYWNLLLKNQLIPVP